MREKKRHAVALSGKVLDDIRKHNLHPGFDYQETLRELNKLYPYETLAEFCRYKSKGSISKIISGALVPKHPQGELIYMLYLQTFHRKPPNKGFQE